MDLHAIDSAAAANSAWISETLQRLVSIESPTESSQAVNEAMNFVGEVSRTLGGRVKLHKQKAFGHVSEIRFGPPRSTTKPILLLGHLDTVWPLGTLKTMSWRRSQGRFYGPGVLDMKAGVVMALAAIAILRDLGLTRPVTLLLNSDEEVGSPISRPITESWRSHPQRSSSLSQPRVSPIKRLAKASACTPFTLRESPPTVALTSNAVTPPSSNSRN